MSIGEWRDDRHGAREWISHAKEDYTDEELLKVLRGAFSTGRSIEKQDALIEAVARILERFAKTTP